MKTQKTKLGIFDRFLVEQSYPPRAGSVGIVVTEAIRNKIKWTPEEIEKFKIEDISIGQFQKGLKWDIEKAKGYEVEFEFNDQELKLIKDGITKLDEQESLPNEVRTIEFIKKIGWEKEKKPS